MLSVSLSPEELSPRLRPYGERVSLAAVNGPASAVVSGEPDALAALHAGCEEDGIRAQRIAVDYAAHSVHLEELREGLLEAFAPISPRSGEIPFHSTVTGEVLDMAELGPEYWYRNLRSTVRFEPVVRALLEQGRRTFVEIGPHPVLSFGVQEAIAAAGLDGDATVLCTLRREQGGPQRFTLSLAEAHAAGAGLDWKAFFAGVGVRRVDLPTYPLQSLSQSIGDAGDAGSPEVAAPELEAGLVGICELPEQERRAAMLDLVRSEVAAVLGPDSTEALDTGKAFKELGFDSLASMELRNRLTDATRLPLPATVVFDHPTTISLAAHLAERASGVEARHGLPAVQAAAYDEPIAIIGMACRYPGGIGSPADLWRALAEGRDGISEFPTDRGWDLDRLYHPDPDHPRTSYVREGGFLAGATE